MSSAQCQRYQLATVCVLGCCCPAQAAQTNLSSQFSISSELIHLAYLCLKHNYLYILLVRCLRWRSSSGCLSERSVRISPLRMCITFVQHNFFNLGLCGQGYFCNARNFCCRCQSGTSPGTIRISGILASTIKKQRSFSFAFPSPSSFFRTMREQFVPARLCLQHKQLLLLLGFRFSTRPMRQWGNSNSAFDCISLSFKCFQQCPPGYACGAGNLCYPVTGSGGLANGR
jgi:hypothetical protein